METEQGEEIQETSRATDDVSLDSKKGSLWQFWDTMAPENGVFQAYQCPVLPTEGTVSLVDTSAADELWQVRQKAGMVSESGQSDYRQRGGGRCGIATGESGRSHRGYLEPGGKEPGSSGNDGLSHRLPINCPEARARVAIAGVMAMRPRCIVLDEPSRC